MEALNAKDKSAETRDGKVFQREVSDEEEKKAMYAALESFRQFRRISHLGVTHQRRQNFYALPTEHRQILSEGPLNLPANFDRVDSALDTNADIADRIAEAAASDLGDGPKTVQVNVTPSDLVKARSTIRHLFRDWSAGGAPERRACYHPVLQDLELEYGRIHNKAFVRVLVPGAGLFRLVFEICRKGYIVEGNEISWHQTLASNWVLNHIKAEETHPLFPFADEFTNLVSRRHQFWIVNVPDIHPGSALAEASEGSRVSCDERFRQTTGDFIGIYSKPEYKAKFDFVATVFFLDTAPNVIRYIETVHHCLKLGGLWSNVGPLLWHFDNRVPKEEGEDESMKTHGNETTGIEEPGSFELTDEEVILLIKKMGFMVVRHEVDTKVTGYMQNRSSMLYSSYRPSHWVARKWL